MMDIDQSRLKTGQKFKITKDLEVRRVDAEDNMVLLGETGTDDGICCYVPLDWIELAES